MAEREALFSLAAAPSVCRPSARPTSREAHVSEMFSNRMRRQICRSLPVSSHPKVGGPSERFGPKLAARSACSVPLTTNSGLIRHEHPPPPARRSATPLPALLSVGLPCSSQVPPSIRPTASKPLRSTNFIMNKLPI